MPWVCPALGLVSRPAILGRGLFRISPERPPRERVLALTSDAVCFAPDAIYAALRVFKYGTSGFAPRVAITIPTADESDPIRCLFRRLLAVFQGRPHAQWFVQRDLLGATAAGLHAAGAIAPLAHTTLPALSAAVVLQPPTRVQFLSSA
jgi:hypothetical protein